jgi:hypothetical protein
MPAMWRLGGHLGSSVSALVDGQLDDETAERAWGHVMHCVPCRRLVEHEGWVLGGHQLTARLFLGDVIKTVIERITMIVQERF